jgi:hypothetical protein
MANIKRFRFDVHGYIEVLAETPLQARQALINPVNQSGRAFTINEGPVFVFCVPSANAPREETE